MWYTAMVLKTFLDPNLVSSLAYINHFSRISLLLLFYCHNIISSQKKIRLTRKKFCAYSITQISTFEYLTMQVKI